MKANNKDKYNQIKPRIKKLRQELELKQREIAEKIDVSGNTYSKWENEINDIPIEKANKLANAFNVSLDYLFGITDKNTNTKLKEINLKVLCERLLNLRIDSNLSQTKLGDLVGIHQRTYSHFENGDRIPTIYDLIYLSQFYNVSLDYLVGRSDKKGINL